ncbi:MAG: hypothetical protein GY765_04445 [bacterium]|nr:hypothetical protein [bacterium]
MKIKGLANVLEQIEELETILNEKIDSLEWEDSSEAKDRQRQEFWDEGICLLDTAKDALNEIKELHLEDF